MMSILYRSRIFDRSMAMIIYDTEFFAFLLFIYFYLSLSLLPSPMKGISHRRLCLVHHYNLIYYLIIKMWLYASAFLILQVPGRCLEYNSQQCCPCHSIDLYRRIWDKLIHLRVSCCFCMFLWLPGVHPARFFPCLNSLVRVDLEDPFCFI